MQDSEPFWIETLLSVLCCSRAIGGQLARRSTLRNTKFIGAAIGFLLFVTLSAIPLDASNVKVQRYAMREAAARHHACAPPPREA